MGYNSNILTNFIPEIPPLVTSNYGESRVVYLYD